MRSAKRVSAVLVATAPVAVLLTGCVSTQTVAARARLVDARILASQKATVVTQANPAVSVEAPVVIRSPSGAAIIVAVHNDSARQLTDLPISVGVRTPSGGTRYLNRSTTLDYFASHIAAIGPDASAEWVFTTGTIPRGRPFAAVGVSQLHPTLGRSLPSVAVSEHRAQVDAGGVILEVSVRNRSAIPQYDLPVYAVALRDGHAVAAGRGSVTHIGTRGTTSATVALFGSARYDSVRLIASPTIFN